MTSLLEPVASVLHQVDEKYPWLWLANCGFMLLAILFPRKLTCWQSDAYTSQPRRNYGPQNFLMQSVTGYVYHQVKYNIWTHILTFPIDITWWGIYFAYFGNYWVGHAGAFYWGHYALSILQLITYSFGPATAQGEVCDVLHGDKAADVDLSDKKNWPLVKVQIRKKRLPKYHFYWFQFLITTFFFTMWYTAVPLLIPSPKDIMFKITPEFIWNLIPVSLQGSDIFWINVFLIFNSIIRVTGHMADYLPPIMFDPQHHDAPFDSMGKGLIPFLQNMSWKVFIQTPLGILSELCAGYPGRLYVWRLVANLRKVLNVVGIPDEKQTFFTMNWKEVEGAKQTIIDEGWNAWPLTAKLFAWAEVDETDDDSDDDKKTN